jgi:hypothetical protein
MSAPRLRDPLRRPAFRRLAFSYGVNELGDWLGIIALSVLVFEQTDSALATALLFLGTGFLPALLTPVVVARLERPPPRFVLPVIYAGEAAAFGALALLADNFSLAAVVAVATIDGALALTARALTRAVSAAMLEPEGELRAGNAVLNVAFTGSAALGPAVAGAAVAAFGAQTALLLDAVSFYAIAWILLGTRELPHVEPEPGRVRDQVRAGLGYIRQNRILSRLLGAQAAAFVFFSAVFPIRSWSSPPGWCTPSSPWRTGSCASSNGGRPSSSIASTRSPSTAGGRSRPESTSSMRPTWGSFS